MTILPINAPQSDAGNLIVTVARARARERGSSYAKANAPTSPMAGLTGNAAPERSILGWLKNRNKCNQFVGDVLTLAGFAMPTFRMSDGSWHFMHAEALLDQNRFFKRVGPDVSPGDLLVIDGPGRGENSAHVEIVTSVRSTGPADIELSSIAALEDGVVERKRSAWFQGAVWREAGGYFQRGSLKAFFLRPFATRAREH